jgi:hypothetical protein
MSQCPVSIVLKVRFGSWRIAATSSESRWLPIVHAMEVARCSASGGSRRPAITTWLRRAPASEAAHPVPENAPVGGACAWNGYLTTR